MEDRDTGNGPCYSHYLGGLLESCVIEGLEDDIFKNSLSAP